MVLKDDPLNPTHCLLDHCPKTKKGVDRHKSSLSAGVSEKYVCTAYTWYVHTKLNLCKLRQIRWQFDFKNTELFKAVHLLAVLRVSPKDLSTDELLRAVRTLTTATSELLSATQPENIEVSNNG